MKQFLLGFFVCILGIASLQAQQDMPIEIRKKSETSPTRYFQNDVRLKMPKLKKLLKPNPTAYKDLRAAQSSKTFATILSGTGGFLIGWPIGTALSGTWKKPKWWLAGVGAGFALIAIPIEISGNKKLQSSVEQYNSGLQTSSMLNKIEVNLSLKGNGVGIEINF